MIARNPALATKINHHRCSTALKGLGWGTQPSRSWDEACVCTPSSYLHRGGNVSDAPDQFGETHAALNPDVNTTSARLAVAVSCGPTGPTLAADFSGLELDTLSITGGKLERIAGDGIWSGLTARVIRIVGNPALTTIDASLAGGSFAGKHTEFGRLVVEENPVLSTPIQQQRCEAMLRLSGWSVISGLGGLVEGVESARMEMARAPRPTSPPCYRAEQELLHSTTP